MIQTRPLPDIDDLDRAIVRLSARINAASYELLVLVRRFAAANCPTPRCGRWCGSRGATTRRSCLPSL